MRAPLYYTIAISVNYAEMFRVKSRVFPLVDRSAYRLCCWKCPGAAGHPRECALLNPDGNGEPRSKVGVELSWLNSCRRLPRRWLVRGLVGTLGTPARRLQSSSRVSSHDHRRRLFKYPTSARTLSGSSGLSHRPDVFKCDPTISASAFST